jgi:hypothetical protein
MEYTATEKEEALTLMRWAMLHPICREYLIHIANERKCDARHGASLKLQGVRSGVSDYFLAYPTTRYSGLWIELKRRQGGTINPNQLTWMQKMKEVGYDAQVARGWEEAKDKIEEYLNETKINNETATATNRAALKKCG